MDKNYVNWQHMQRKAIAILPLDFFFVQRANWESPNSKLNVRTFAIMSSSIKTCKPIWNSCQSGWSRSIWTTPIAISVDKIDQDRRSWSSPSYLVRVTFCHYKKSDPLLSEVVDGSNESLYNTNEELDPNLPQHVFCINEQVQPDVIYHKIDEMYRGNSPAKNGRP